LFANITSVSSSSAGSSGSGGSGTPADVAANLAAPDLAYDGTDLKLTGTTDLDDGTYEVTVNDGTTSVTGVNMTVSSGNFAVPVAGLTLADGAEVTIEVTEAGYTGTANHTLAVSLDSLIAEDATTLTGTLSGITLTAPITVDMNLAVNGGVTNAYTGIAIAQDGTFTISTINPDLANNDLIDVSAVIGGVTVTGTGMVDDTMLSGAGGGGVPFTISSYTYNDGNKTLTLTLDQPVVAGCVVEITNNTTTYTYGDSNSAFSLTGNDITIDFTQADDQGNTYTPQTSDIVDITVTNGDAATGILTNQTL
jgi:hypothetical protein